jgi:hypothetical protein
LGEGKEERVMREKKIFRRLVGTNLGPKEQTQNHVSLILGLSPTNYFTRRYWLFMRPFNTSIWQYYFMYTYKKNMNFMSFNNTISNKKEEE